MRSTYLKCKKGNHVMECARKVNSSYTYVVCYGMRIIDHNDPIHEFVQKVSLYMHAAQSHTSLGSYVAAISVVYIISTK